IRDKLVTGVQTCALPIWPLPIGLIAAVLFIGAALLFGAIAVRRQSITLGAIVLLFAALWNAGIVFAFMSPHNRHVFHLATHQKRSEERRVGKECKSRSET